MLKTIDNGKQNSESHKNELNYDVLEGVSGSTSGVSVGESIIICQSLQNWLCLKS